MGELADNPARCPRQERRRLVAPAAELATLALMRLAANDPEAAALQLDERWDKALPPDLSAWAWASVAGSRP